MKKTFKDLLLNEKDLSELESDLRILKDRRKNMSGMEPTPAEAGERAAKLDNIIDILETKIKKLKNKK
jgi:hypothetical protein